MLHYTCSITKYRKDELCISIRTNSDRFRYYNGHAIGEPDKPNLLPVNKRYKGFQELLIKFQIALRSGWVPKKPVLKEKDPVISFCSHTKAALVLEGLKSTISYSYYRKLKYILLCIKKINHHEVNEAAMLEFLLGNSTWSATTYNTFRRHIGVLENLLTPHGYNGNCLASSKRRRQTEVLHKRITNLPEVLGELKEFHPNLHLCCLLAYGCLLRPHREIRELTWGDFNNDLTQISLAGKRNKSKVNRIVPVPLYVREHLFPKDNRLNIFTGKTETYKEFYFSNLWSKFMKHTQHLSKGHTLYSFRHTGAIAVYEKTKNIKVLQTVMGHSDMAVSLTYLRGLDVMQIDQNDMPDM